MKKITVIAIIIFVSLQGFSQNDSTWNHSLGLNLSAPYEFGFSNLNTNQFKLNYTPSFTAFSPNSFFHRVELIGFNFFRASNSSFSTFSFSLGTDYTFGKRLYNNKWFSFDLGLATRFLGGYNKYETNYISSFLYLEKFGNIGTGIGIAPQFNIKLNNRISLTSRINFQYFSVWNYNEFFDNTISESKEWSTSDGTILDIQIGLNVSLF